MWTEKRADQQRARNAADPDRRRNYHLQHMYGMSAVAYDKMLADQGGGCAICTRPQGEGQRRLHVDHDHNCCPGIKSCGECIRGLLCFECNTGIGKFSDNAATVASALAYLTRSSTWQA